MCYHRWPLYILDFCTTLFDPRITLPVLRQTDIATFFFSISTPLAQPSLDYRSHIACFALCTPPTEPKNYSADSKHLP